MTSATTCRCSKVREPEVPHRDYNMDLAYKLNVITGDLCRYARRCTTATAFVDRTVKLVDNLINHGYEPWLVNDRICSFGARHWRANARSPGGLHSVARDIIRREPRPKARRPPPPLPQPPQPPQPPRLPDNTVPGGGQPGPTRAPAGPEKIPCHARLDSFSSFLILN